MTISTTTRKAGPYAGNGAQTGFAFAFKIFATSDVVVVKAVSPGVDSTLVLGVDYTVSMNGDQDVSPGGSITAMTPPAVGQRIVITSEVPQLQSAVVTNGGGFFPSVFNGLFDKLIILVQQLAEKITRTLSISITASGVTSLQVPVVPFGVLRWNAGGTALETALVLTAAVAGQVAFPAIQNPSSDPNTLDDYERGSVSLSVTAGGTPPTGVTYSNQNTQFVKIGRVVTLTSTITLSSKGASGVGAVRLTGLPFTPQLDTPIAIGNLTGLTLAANERLTGVASNAGYIAFQKSNLTTFTNLDWADIGAAFSFSVTVTYITPQ